MLTIGHSTLPLELFLGALRSERCTLLVDVRRYPGSRRNPQYSPQTLSAALGAAGIEASWREGLGGRRAPLEGSVNTGWRNASFRGYADYMQGPEFAAELEWLMGLPNLGSTVVMCAEAVPWRCHRSLIADAGLARGEAVEDIFVDVRGRATRKPHTMTPFAQMEASRVFYPVEGVQQADLFK